jgi:hypothetical protein
MVESDRISGLISAAAQVNSFIIMGGILALAVLGAKLFIKKDAGTVEVAGIDIPLNHTWLIMALLTIAHIYCAFDLMVETAGILKCGELQLSKTAWNALTRDAEKLPFMSHMAERSPLCRGWACFSDVRAISFVDRLMALHILLLLGVFAATVRWFRTSSWLLRILTTLVALLLLTMNWMAGSQWALLASDLARDGKGEAQEMYALRDEIVFEFGAKCPSKEDGF